eukprot:753020-Hanusia_phi.AAC.4
MAGSRFSPPREKFVRKIHFKHEQHNLPDVFILSQNPTCRSDWPFFTSKFTDPSQIRTIKGMHSISANDRNCTVKSEKAVSQQQVWSRRNRMVAAVSSYCSRGSTQAPSNRL